MTDAFQLRRWAIFAVIVPLAILLGVALTSPFDTTTIGLIGLLSGAMVLPLFLRWHHTFLIFSWNATITLYLLPAQPDLWHIVTLASLGITAVTKALNNELKFTYIPSATWPILAFGAVVIFTALARRITSLEPGFENEIRRYVFIIIALLGYFALSVHKIPQKRAMFYASLFFLSGTVAVLSDLVFLLGPKFYFLYYLFPVRLARLQAEHEFTPSGLFRLEGVAWASVSLCCFILLRYGARGLLDLRYPWRMAFFLAAVAATLLGGFRSRLLLVGLLFLLQFCFEGLWRTRWLAILIAVGIAVSAAVIPFSDKLPHPFQRALSFLPVKIDPVVQRDAEESTRWRVEMWQMLLPEVPEYFWLGKGYVHSATAYYLSRVAELRGWTKSYESFILTGDYHNGPLSVIIPFGIWGLIAFVWLIIAGWRILYQNYKNGPPHLTKINTFLLTFYTARAVFFFVVYGAVEAELMLFTGVLGLSIAINGGVYKRPAEMKDAPIAAKAPLALK